ncbi:tail fiber protein [soil metagenome]
MEGVIGTVTMFAGNFAPKAWAFCQGQIMTIASNTALFSILGTTYGGNGTTTFGLPDTRSRSVVSAGQGPGLSPYSLGEMTGVPTETLTLANMAVHVHPVAINAAPPSATTGSSTSPATAAYAPDPNGNPFYTYDNSASMAPYNLALTMTPSGGNQPFNIQHPYLGMNYIICLQGIFPARN